MDSQDFAVLKQVQTWLHHEISVLLVTVVRTWGASPRPVGALLGLSEDGLAVGSVSGGCIEDDLLDQIKHKGMPKQPALMVYGETAEEAKRLGLPCGGSMQLVLEPLMAPKAMDEVLNGLAAGQVVARRLDCEAGIVTINNADHGAATQFNHPVLTSIYGPRYRLLLIGAGQLSQLLAEIAISLDFVVTVCDPRQAYSALWKVPNTMLTQAMPDDVVLEMQPDSRMAVVTLTHDPKLDDLALIEALKSQAFYVAALGSRQSNAARRKRLAEFDLTDDQVNRLYGPAGLFVGSKTPAEIAVSIAAELVAVKNAVNKAHNQALSSSQQNVSGACSL